MKFQNRNSQSDVYICLKKKLGSLFDNNITKVIYLFIHLFLYLSLCLFPSGCVCSCLWDHCHFLFYDNSPFGVFTDNLYIVFEI